MLNPKIVTFASAINTQEYENLTCCHADMNYRDFADEITHEVKAVRRNA